jgi:alpha-L-fucosidase
LITAKHHDGFALWPSKVSEYNVVDATPFQRDILGELAAACKKHDLALGFYYSHWLDWGNPGGLLPSWATNRRRGGKKSTLKLPTQTEYDQYWQNTVLPQVTELIERYDPKFLWFDTWTESPYLTEQRLDELITLVRTESPDTLINSRIGTTWNHSKGDELVDYLSMGDNKFPKEKISRVWETSGTMQRSWGYHQSDPEWKPVSELLRYLVDNVSRGGNFQLNVGPMGDGSFPQESLDRLKEIGAWMAVNGESIYSAGPVFVPDSDWGQLTGKQVDKSYRIYMHVYEWPKADQTLTVPQLDILPRKAFLLESGKVVKTNVDKGNLQVTVPTKKAPDERITVIVLEYDQNPVKSNAK